MAPTGVVPSDVASFRAHLNKSRRILALLGAGLSASSGLATFRGAGGLWHNHEASALATPEAFASNPALVWQFYGERRRAALRAQPNAAHRALADLARRNPEFVCLTQNVDGLSQRAGHPSSQLHLLHGSLFDLRCTEFYCSYSEQENFSNPLVPGRGAICFPPASASASASASLDPNSRQVSADVSQGPMQAPEILSTSEPSGHRTEASSAAANAPPGVTKAPMNPLPACPSCHGLLRPGVVWFNEILPQPVLAAMDSYFAASEPIDLMLVIGTRATVYPAAAYVEEARARGARLAVVNTDAADMPPGGLAEGDWAFVGDAASIVPTLLETGEKS